MCQFKYVDPTTLTMIGSLQRAIRLWSFKPDRPISVLLLSGIFLGCGSTSNNPRSSVVPTNLIARAGVTATAATTTALGEPQVFFPNSLDPIGVSPIAKTRIAFGKPQVFFPNGILPNAQEFAERAKSRLLTPATFVDVRIKSPDEEILCRSSPPLYADLFVVRPQVAELNQLSGFRSTRDLNELLGRRTEWVSGPWEHGAICSQWRVCNGSVGSSFKAFEVTVVADSFEEGNSGKPANWRILVIMARESIRFHPPSTLED
jgi:hypothetical protein